MFKNIKKHDALLVGGGVLLGTLGVKALTSKPAKKLYVQAVATGLRAKASYEDVVEQAKAQVDDIVAEASYIAKADAKPAEDACGCAGAAPAPVVA
ncbi:MAG: DUF1490 family protein [Coriobacteriia bacterium]|nr:DUF1490 family protein [Coriobacteriia bacterium]MBS5479035.1 DUF1490 family protein [Coriobacteriia bacterium]